MPTTTIANVCPTCDSVGIRTDGKLIWGVVWYWCPSCSATFTDAEIKKIELVNGLPPWTELYSVRCPCGRENLYELPDGCPSDVHQCPCCQVPHLRYTTAPCICCRRSNPKKCIDPTGNDGPPCHLHGTGRRY